MKIERKALLTALKAALKVTTGKNTFPILSCVLIDGPGQQIVATDLETAVILPLEISDYTRTMSTETVEEDLLEGLKGPQLKQLAEDYGITLPKGKPTVTVTRETIMTACQNAAGEEKEWQEKFCLHGKSLQNIISTIEDDTVEIALAKGEDADTLSFMDTENPYVRIGENFHNLAAFSVDDFPVVEKENLDEVPAISVCRENLSNVAMAACNDKTGGFNLSMAYFDCKENSLVATDGHRLHWVPLEKPPENAMSFGLPLGPMKILLSESRKGDSLSFKYDNEKKLVQSPLGENGVLQTRVMEGSFPDWQAVVKRQPQKNVTVAKAAIETPLLQALSISGSDFNGVRIRFNGGMDVEFTNPHKGEYQKVSIPIQSKSYKDDETLIGINGRFLLDAMKPIESENLEIGFTDQSEAMFFKHENFNALVMPMRL